MLADMGRKFGHVPLCKSPERAFGETFHTAQTHGAPRLRPESGWDALPCQVRNISDRGAMLEFLGHHATMVENAFDLVLADAKVRYAVKVVWRKERTTGVLFSLEQE